MSVRLAYAMTRSRPSSCCMRMAPITAALVSVSNVNGYRKSGQARMGVLANYSLRVIKFPFCDASHHHFSFFCSKSMSGPVIVAIPLMKQRYQDTTPRNLLTSSWFRALPNWLDNILIISASHSSE